MNERSIWLTAMAVMLPTFMEVLDTSIVNVALPHMQGSFSATQNEITWVLTSYLVANAIVLPMSGWLAGVFGRKAYLLGCVVVFTAASFLCASADSLIAMVLYRTLQGAAGGALQPLSQATLLETFPGERRGSAMALWGMGIVVAPLVAPLLGGWLTDNYSWHWVFLINVPVGAAAVLAITAFVFDPPYARRRRVTVDIWGIFFLVVGIGALQMLLDLGERYDWFASRTITLLAVVSGTSLLALVIHEVRSKQPILNLRVFADRTFAAGTSLMFIFGFALYGTLTLIPLLVQHLFGYSALQSGLVLSPRGIGVIVTMGLAGRLLARWDVRWVILLGFPFLIYSSVEMAHFSLMTRFGDIVAVMVVQGLGMGFIFVPLSAGSMARVAPAQMSNATGIFNLMRNVGGSIGIATTQTLLARGTQTHHLELARHISPSSLALERVYPELAVMLSRYASDAGTAVERARALLDRFVNAQAAMIAYDENFWLFAAAFVVMIPLVLLMGPGRAHRPVVG